MARLKVGVLISGRGSNLQALIDACRDRAFPAEIAIVVSNVVDAPGLKRARAADIPIEVISHKSFADRPTFETALTAALKQYDVGLVCLAGFMRVLTARFVDAWTDRLINVHPSLLPAFPGLHTHGRALEAGVRFSGCTIHFVRTDVDAGPIIVQAAVPVVPDDSPESLAARVLEAEHRCFPLALRLIAEGRVTIRGNAVVIDGALGPPPTAVNPCPPASAGTSGTGVRG